MNSPMNEDDVLKIVRDFMLTLNPAKRKRFNKELEDLIKNYEGIPF